jgi:ComF family protein
MKKLFHGAKSLILNLLFPAECLGCRREGDWLCADCFKKLQFGDQNKNYHLIAPQLAGIFIAGDYDDRRLAGLIKKLKYKFLTSLGKILGRFLILFWSQQLARADFRTLAPDKNSLTAPLVIPIPLSPRRARWRGFNQAEILARELNAHFGYEISNGLRRVRHQKPQAALDEKERLNNIKNAFAWNGEALGGRTIILVDDVVTTGATLNEAALVLRAAGAAKVYGLVLAKG